MWRSPKLSSEKWQEWGGWEESDGLSGAFPSSSILSFVRKDEIRGWRPTSAKHPGIILGLPPTSAFLILIATPGGGGDYDLYYIGEEDEVRKSNFPKVTLEESGIYGTETQLCVTPRPEQKSPGELRT